MTPRDSLYWYRAIVRRVFDGDTISSADVDFGMQQWVMDRALRLYGVDTAERYSRDRLEKQLALAAWEEVRALVPVGTEIMINTYRDETGQYGRLLVHVYVEKDGGWVSVNNHLLETTRLGRPYVARKADRVPWLKWYELNKAIIDGYLHSSGS